MNTVAGSGHSTHEDTGPAVKAAVQQALGALGGQRPGYGLVFASPRHAMRDVIYAAAAATPRTDIIGCASAGEITERGLSHDGVAVLLVTDDGAHCRELVYTQRLSTALDAATSAITQGLRTAQERGAKQGFGRTNSVLLVDGLGGQGEPLLRAMRDATEPWHHIVGGAAGDNGEFKATPVATNRDGAHTDAAAVLHFVSRNPWGIGVGHGLKPRSNIMRVTRAKGNIVHEIDGRPAFETYRDYAQGLGIEIAANNAGEFMINHELGVYWFERLDRARAPIAVNEDGSLVCAAEIDEGSKVCIIDGQQDDLVEAAREAAKEAAYHLEGREAAAVLMFDCICRGTILKDNFNREVEAVAEVFPGVPIAGFLTYGEIARYKGPFNSWHNTTAVIAAIPK